MLGKSFGAIVKKANPYGYEVRENACIGVELSLAISTEEGAFLDDLLPNDLARGGIKRLFAGEIPVKGLVPIKTRKFDKLILTFPGCTELECDLVEVKTQEIALKNFSASMKLKAKEVDEEIIGKMGAQVKQTVSLKLVEVEFTPEEKQARADEAKKKKNKRFNRRG